MIEWEDSGAWTPVIVKTGSLWKLLLDLGKWENESPDYCKSWWSYINAYACREWLSVPMQSRTYRKIVKVGEEYGTPSGGGDYPKMDDHLKVTWF